MNQYILEVNHLESSTAEKDPEIWVNSKMNMSQQRVLVAKKANGVLGCMSKSIASRLREVVLSLSAGHTWNTASSSGFPSTRERQTGEHPVQATKKGKGLEHLSYGERLSELGLFGLEKAQGISSMYKYLKGGCKEDRTRLFSVVPSDWTRGNGHKLKYMTFHLNIRKDFSCEGGQALEQASRRD
ncbi:LOW QUALITY PROTEIN: hypothetical protein QYF61_016841, partial [Mycteria americana]